MNKQNWFSNKNAFLLGLLFDNDNIAVFLYYIYK